MTQELSDSELWRGFKKHNRQRKNNNLSKARIDELPEGTVKYTQWHWGIPTPYGCHINYWPSTGKWDDPRPGGTMCHGDFKSFKGWLRKFMKKAYAEREQGQRL